MDAWEILVSNSSLPEVGHDAWEHLNNQMGGSGQTIYREGLIQMEICEMCVDMQVDESEILIQVDNEPINIEVDEEPVITDVCE